MVLVAIMMVPLFGFVAFGVDLSYLYAVKSQLATASNAAAHAAALEVARGRRTTAAATAVAYGDSNRARVTVNPITAANVTPGVYNPATTPTFTPAAAWTDAGVNAVRAVAVDNTPLLFARVMGRTTALVLDTTVAAVGSATASGCVKPWAVPYREMARAAGRSDWETNRAPLTSAEVNTLVTNRTEIMFKVVAGGGPAALGPGNYYAVQFPILESKDGTPKPYGEPQGGGDPYRDEIASQDCDDRVEAGDWLQTQTGALVGPTNQGAAALCGGNPGGGTCGNMKVVLPIWKEDPSKPGSTQVRVAYIGAFVLTRYTGGGEVWGYFSSFGFPGGGFTTAPGPITKVVLTQ